MNLPRRLWMLLREPRAITALTLVAYLILIGVGYSTITAPPASIREELGWVTTLWGALLLAGGLIGALAVPRGIWWVEKLALLFAATGTAIYFSTVVQLHLESEIGNRIPQAGFILLGLVALATRYLRIRYAALDPRPLIGD